MTLDFDVISMTRLRIHDLVRQWYAAGSRGSMSRDGQQATMSASAAIEPHATSGRNLIAPAQGTKDDPEPVLDIRREIAGQIAADLQLTAILYDLPARIRALTIVPDDSLHAFPFAAITYRERYLIEDYRLSIRFDRAGSARSTRPAQAVSALVVGVSRGTHLFAPLPGVLRELKEVTARMEQQQIPVLCLADDHADRERILRALPSAALVHVASHGLFETDQPDQSGVVLVPAPNQVEMISLRDLADLDLTGLRHITLSSCWSADHFILPGRRIISLPETLWRSGARSILANLWEVDDQLAIAFMARFYEYLAKSPRDQALRQVQLDCLSGRLLEPATANRADPFYWAGFALYGEGGPVV
jgi:CHAT domain-containing protein